MTSRHYDVIVLGRSLGALAAAVLLARRDFRVLVLGQGQKPSTYRFDGRRLQRRAFTFLSAPCPTFRRILHELAQTQTFRRYLRPLDPMFAVLGHGYRLELPPSLELFAREVDREFPEVRQLVDEMYGRFANVNATLDSIFDRDLVFPPGTLWERFETGRAVSPMTTWEEQAEPLLGKFPAGHPYRDATLLPALFGSDLSPSSGLLTALALSRLHGSWTRGLYAVEGGEDGLHGFLRERLEAHGGECRPADRAQRIVVRGRKVSGIVEEGQENTTSGDAIVADLPGEEVAELARGEGITRAAERDWPRLTAEAGRFVVSIVMRRRGLPEMLPEESFLVPAKGARPDPRRLTVRLQRPSDSTQERPDEVLLVAEALIPRRGALTLLEARAAVLSTLREHLPFLDEHLVLVDSPHDGLPLYDYTTTGRREIDRMHVTETSPGPEPMRWLWSTDPPGYLGLGGEPIRGPIPGTFLVGSTVLPALGQEGQLLSAWSAARLITRSDRDRLKMRRDMWTKIETG